MGWGVKGYAQDHLYKESIFVTMFFVADFQHRIGSAEREMGSQALPQACDPFGEGGSVEETDRDMPYS